MSEVLMTLCDRCAEKIDADRNQSGTYYLTEKENEREIGHCDLCFQEKACCRYRMKSKAVLAMEREIRKRKEPYRPKHDRRAHYREPWRN